jgi:CoA:oxalate CoA-transferase
MTTSNNESTHNNLPLSGIRVIDFTTFLSGPFCTQILGDMGAEIIKIEPFTGDSSRSIPPYFVGDDSAYYLSTNRNKKSIALDLKSSEGIKIATGLILESDVVIENFRPGVCKRLGLDEGKLREKNNKLIWASISGFGQTGEWREYPAYDMIIQALSGVMSLTGEEGEKAVRLGIPAGDTIAGMYAGLGIVTSLFKRGSTGTGQHIDVSMLDCLLTMLSYQAQYHLVAGTNPGPQGAKHDSIPTYRSFEGKGGREFVVTANTDRMWVNMCEVMDLEELPKDPRFNSATNRLTNKEALWAILEARFAEDSAEYWVESLKEKNVPTALIKSVPEAIADAKDYGREMVVPLTHADGRSIDSIGSPIKLSGVDIPKNFPPKLSENSAELIQSILKLSTEEYSALVEKGVVK